MSANAFVYDQIIGSFAATRTFQFFRWTQISGSPVKGNATEANFNRRSTPSSNASQPFANCITISKTSQTDPRHDFVSPAPRVVARLPFSQTNPTREMN